MRVDPSGERQPVLVAGCWRPSELPRYEVTSVVPRVHQCWGEMVGQRRERYAASSEHLQCCSCGKQRKGKLMVGCGETFSGRLKIGRRRATLAAVAQGLVYNPVYAARRVGIDVFALATLLRGLAFSAVDAPQRLDIRAYTCGFVSRHGLQCTGCSAGAGIDVVLPRGICIPRF